MTRVQHPLVAIISLIGASSPATAAPAPTGGGDALLRRVPPDAAMAVVVEDASAHARRLAASPLLGGLSETSPVREWLESDDGRHLRRAVDDVEAVLGADLGTIGDALLGEAVVLSLHLRSDDPPERARGLLQTRVADRDLLFKLIGAMNASERAGGARLRIQTRRHPGASYRVRSFGDPARPTEAYALLDDGTFAWTNDEALLRGVIDRADDPSLPSMADRPGLARARAALPGDALAWALVEPDALGRMIAADPDAPRAEEVPRALLGYLRAIEGLGAALRWDDGPVLEVVEALDPDRLPAPLRSWASSRGGPDDLLGTLPASTLLAAAGHVDAAALYDLVTSSVPESGRDDVEHLTMLVRGLMLDRDPRSEILPNLGPGAVGWVDPPSEGAPLRRVRAVLAMAVGGDDGVPEALESALRTAVALVALDSSDSADGPLRVVSERIGPVRLTGLTAGEGLASARFAFAVGRGMLVIGTDAGAVAGAFADRGDAPRPDALRARDRYFPDASSFVFVDLDAAHRLLEARRDDVVAALGDREEAAGDLGHVLEWIALFRGAYATSTLSPDATLARRRVGLIVDEPGER